MPACQPNATSPKKMKIDAHHHFWKYTAAQYGWIDDAMSAIRRDFLPSDLEKEIRAAGIDGVISVQARQTLEETRWLLAMAAQHDFIKGVVGWVPLTDPSVHDELDSLRDDPRLRAVRHVVQGESDGYLLRKDFNAGVSVLREMALAYDLLICERQLPEAIRFVDQHPDQVFVLDHLAKPLVKENRLDPWRQNLRELARRENVYCKVSGLVMEADFGAWTEAQLQPYFETALEAFGSHRLMFGSDWPVCLVACPYQRWYDAVCCFAESLSAEEKTSFFGRIAARVYGLHYPG
jgi:L-fucono-1,5-lactonase